MVAASGVAWDRDMAPQAGRRTARGRKLGVGGQRVLVGLSGRAWGRGGPRLAWGFLRDLTSMIIFAQWRALAAAGVLVACVWASPGMQQQAALFICKKGKKNDVKLENWNILTLMWCCHY